jgi:hypothetical protein
VRGELRRCRASARTQPVAGDSGRGLPRRTALGRPLLAREHAILTAGRAVPLALLGSAHERSADRVATFVGEEGPDTCTSDDVSGPASLKVMGGPQSCSGSTDPAAQTPPAPPAGAGHEPDGSEDQRCAHTRSNPPACSRQPEAPGQEARCGWSGRAAAGVRPFPESAVTTALTEQNLRRLADDIGARP